MKSYTLSITARWYRCHHPNVLFRGLIAGLEHDGMCQGVTKRAGRYPLARQVLLSLCAANAGSRHPGD
jgi:hypothetical protein